MKTYKERTEDVLAKIEQKKKVRRRVRGGVAVGLVLVMALVLFLPYGDQPPSVRQYMGSPYYDLIKKLNAAKFEKPKYENLFSEFTGAAGEVLNSGLTEAPDAVPDAPDYSQGEESGNTYQEITDNQVQGVIEGDLIKRSDKVIYYLHRDRLSIYSIAEADSKEVGSYGYSFEGNGVISWYTAENRQMYLSEDCTTVTLVLAGYGDVLDQGEKDYFLCVIGLDVTDPGSIQEIDRVYLTGSYVSSRLVEGKLMLMSQYHIPREVDFAQPVTFVPQIGEPGGMECIPANSVIAPDELSNTTYTVVTMLDQKTLDVTDTAAFLSYNSQLYVSKNKIFATRGYTDTEKTLTRGVYTTMTEIACMGYGADGLEELGSVQIEGAVKNQYSMDEYNGVLRVVTSTSVRESTIDVSAGSEHFAPSDRKRNANLYCINLTDWSVIAKVEAFAPEGETVESVRFDGNYAHVCTAEVITLTDPVYFFDLSDLSNITWKDTGTIEGYSSSLVNFGNGNLIGIGFGGGWGLKIEAYRETDTGVKGVCAYELDASFSDDYKSYYIDRENQLIGLSVCTRTSDCTGERYILLGFDGSSFHELVNIPVEGSQNELRGVVVDGWLYVFGDGFDIAKVW